MVSLRLQNLPGPLLPLDAMSRPHVFRWILDVDPLWPLPPESDNRSPPERPLTQQWAAGESAQASLKYLSPTERSKVLRFHFSKDAKLSLASCLLKRRAIVDVCAVPWFKARIGEDENRKPCHIPDLGAEKTLEFNISHHGTLVALAGCEGSSIKVGIDVVTVNWEKDYASVVKEGFEQWVKTYEAVFSDREIDDMVHYTPSQTASARETTLAKIRHFYAHWCMKEAWVKMTGQALISPDLKDLEFREVSTPQPAGQLGWSSEWGETFSGVEIWYYGKKLTSAQMVIQAFRDDYMVAVAASAPSVELSPYKILDLEKDVLPQEDVFPLCSDLG